MAAELTIGAFSRVTHLSVKTLRHYHDWGVLAPATVDPDSGYRYYSPAQVSTAQTIRRYRDLEMPAERVKAVLAAPNAEARDALVADHLRRMEQQLARTQEAVASLRALLEIGPPAPAIAHVTLGPLETIAITETVDRVRLENWWRDAFTELFELLRRARRAPAGPPGGMYEHSLFEDDLGQCTVYVPVDAPVPAAGRAAPRHVEPRALAVAVHAGPHADADLVYGALGTHVTELGIDGGGPAFERYLVSEFSGEADPDQWRMEIGWPISPPTTS